MIYIQATTECRFNLNCVWSMIRTHRLLVHVVPLCLIHIFTGDYAFCITGEMTDSSTHAMYHLKKTQDITICETAFFKLGQKTNGNV